MKHKLLPHGLLVIILCILMLPGCSVHRHTIGKGPVGNGGETVRIASKKQWYFLWGLVRLNNPDIPQMRGDYEDYQIKTAYNVGDYFISLLLSPISISTRTVKILVHKAPPAQRPETEPRE